MNETNQDQALEEIDITIEQAKAAIADRDALHALLQNENFHRIIEERYFKEESIRLVMLKGILSDDKQQTKIDHLMFGISSLDSFFRTIMQEGDQMEQAIRDNQEAKEEILREE
jgi:hypothetical protein